MKFLDNYLVTDKNGYRFVSQKCEAWLGEKRMEVVDVIDDILEFGGTIQLTPKADFYVLGNMYNPEIELDGEIWITGTITKVIHQHGRIIIQTYSGSEYLLMSPFRFNQPPTASSQAPAPGTDIMTDEVFKDPLRFVDNLVGPSV